MAGVAAWGTFHAVGAYFFNHSILRTAVVMGFTVAFLCFWILLLVYHKPRPSRWSQNQGPEQSVQD